MCRLGIEQYILLGVTIGRDANCAAGTVVAKDVPPNSIVGVELAKVIGL